MKTGFGVEWAAHCCVLLAPGAVLKAAQLAAFHGVPPAYMAKQLQALSRAGVVKTVRGAAGGYALARPAAQISLWDIVTAVEPSTQIFQCREIRRQGACPVPPESCRLRCPIAAAFDDAEARYREALSGVTLDRLVRDIAETSDPGHLRRVGEWYAANATPHHGK